MAESQWHLEVNGKKVGPFTLDQIQGLFDDGEIRGYHQVTSDQLHGKWISVQELIDSAGLSAPAPPPEFTGEIPSLKAPAPPIKFESYAPAAPVLEAPVLEAVETVEATRMVSMPELSETAEYVGAEPSLYSSPSEGAAKSGPRTFKEPRQDFNNEFQPPPRPSDLGNSGPDSPDAPPAFDAQPAGWGSGDAVVATTAYQQEAHEDARAAADPAMSLLSTLQNLRERQTSQIQHDPTIMLDIDSLGRNRKPVPVRMWLTAIFAGIVLGALSIGLIKVFKKHPVTGAPGSLTEINQSQPQSPPQAQTPPTLGQAQSAKTQPPVHHELRPMRPANPVLPPQGATAVPANNSIRERDRERERDHEREPQQPPVEQDNRFAEPQGQEPPREMNNPGGNQNPGFPQQQEPQQVDPNQQQNNNGNGFPPPVLPQGDPNMQNGGGNGFPQGQPPGGAYPQGNQGQGNPGNPGNQGNPGGEPNQGYAPQGQGNGEQNQGQAPGQDQFQQPPPPPQNISQ
jgi:hypothetical protein